jgi:hypothetical protein
MIVAYRFLEMTSLTEHKKALPPAQALLEIRDLALAGEEGLDMLISTGIYKKFKS